MLFKHIKELFSKKKIHNEANGEIDKVYNSDPIPLMDMVLDEKSQIVFLCSLPATGVLGTLYIIKEDKGLRATYNAYTWNPTVEKFEHRKTIVSYI